jgi:hypothetical protein
MGGAEMKKGARQCWPNAIFLCVLSAQIVLCGLEW